MLNPPKNSPGQDRGLSCTRRPPKQRNPVSECIVKKGFLLFVKGILQIWCHLRVQLVGVSECFSCCQRARGIHQAMGWFGHFCRSLSHCLTSASWRSEERRVGKECRSGCVRCQCR